MGFGYPIEKKDRVSVMKLPHNKTTLPKTLKLLLKYYSEVYWEIPLEIFVWGGIWEKVWESLYPPPYRQHWSNNSYKLK